MRRRGFLAGAVVLGVGALALAGCGMRPSYRYRMTVEVETPQGVKTGTAVREVSFYSRPQGVYGARIKGEAVAVDLPGGQVLFALLTGEDFDPDHAAWIADWALERELEPGGENADYDAGDFAEIWPTHPRTVSPINQSGAAVPMLVRFADLADPATVQRVDPANLAASFGPGVKLIRITVEKTWKGVTTGIGERLGWLGEFRNHNFNGDRFEFLQKKELSAHLSSGVFTTEIPGDGK